MSPAVPRTDTLPRVLSRPARGGARLRLALIAPLVLGACASPPPLERDWVRVRTEHLEIVSASSAGRTLDLARDLEVFRDVVQAATTLKNTTPRVPTRVYVLDAATWHDLDSGSDGFFLSGPRENALVMRGYGWDAEQHTVLLHEYVHFLVENQQTHVYPLWFSEGWADLLATARIGDDAVTIGELGPGRLRWLLQPDWLDMAEVVSAEDYPAGDEHRARFYAQSLALVHYLQFGRGSYDALREDLATYLGVVQRGGSPETAFREAFGLAPRAAQSAVRAYLVGGAKGVRIPRRSLPSPGEPTAETLGRGEVARRLGGLLLRAGRTRRAADYFARALAEDPDDSRARCGLGTTQSRAGRWPVAEALLRRCLAEAPRDALAHLDWANHLQARAVAEPSAPERVRWLEEARAQCAESLRLEPGLVEAQLQLGSTYLLAGEDARAALAPLADAYALLPANVEVRVRLALALVRVGRRDEARRLVAVGAYRNAADATTGALLRELREELGASPGLPGRDGEVEEPASSEAAPVSAPRSPTSRGRTGPGSR